MTDSAIANTDISHTLTDTDTALAKSILPTGFPANFLSCREEACDPNTFGNFTLCPSCMKHCPYDMLKNKCTITRIVSIFDNSGTVGFSVFMSLWATIFIEFWKRQQVVLAWEWNLSNVDTLTEVVNPEYEAKARVYKLNPVTLRYEPHVPFWERIGRVAAANIILLFMLVLVLCTVTAVIGYRIIMVTLLSSKFSRLVAHVGTTASASMINLAVILGMNKVYGWVATRLTDLGESAVLVVAILSDPASNGLGHSAITSTASHSRCSSSRSSTTTRPSYTSPSSKEGSQAIRDARRIGEATLSISIVKAWWRQRRRRLGKEAAEQKSKLARWEEDYNLEECPKLAPFDEYLQMSIQFGFVTLFVAAFPLAPLFALINNVCEIRLDAYRYSKRLRRPVAERAPNIGAWQAILRLLARCAVICNAFLIAFTSEFIPRLVYQVRHSKGLSLSGYVNFTLATFDTSDFDDVHRPNKSTLNGELVRECRYVGFREPSGTENEYQLSGTFWVITTAQLCFVIIFEHVVFFITGVVAGMIPAMPKSVAQRMKREQIVVQDLIAKLQDIDTAAAAAIANRARLMSM
nr:anoctamin-4-like [Dermacentor andersoni]